MKFSPSSSPEHSGGAPTSEPTESGGSTSSKKKKSVLSVGRTITEKSSAEPAPVPPKFNWIEAMQKQHDAKSSKPKAEVPAPDSPFFVLPKSPIRRHESSDAVPPKPAESAEPVIDGVQPVRDVLESRRTAVEKEAEALQPGSFVSPELAEVAADTRLIDEMERSLPDTGDISEAQAAAVAGSAERTVSELIAGHETPANHADAAEPNTEQSAESGEAELTEGVEALDEAENADPETAAAGAGGEVPPSNPEFVASGDGEDDPATPYAPAAPPPPTPPPFGAGGTTGGSPPSPPSPALIPVSPMTRVGGGGMRPNTVSTADAAYNKQIARSQGVLVGGIVGYLFGRHRGKKIGRRQTEQRLKPVTRGLEKRIGTLQATIEQKEQSIRSLAREKFEALSNHGAAEQQRLVRELRGEAPAGAAVANRVGARPEVAAALAAPLIAGGELYSRDRHSHGDAAATAEVLINERHGEVAPIIPFNKSAEEFSREELMLTAEKVKVDGVTLREMSELGRIKEPGLRRVINEFLRGGNVSQAVSREVTEKELKYERDPKLRQSSQQSGAVSGGGAAGGSGSAGSLLGILGGTGAASAGSQDGADQDGYAGSRQSAYQGLAPRPDEATLRALRNQQLRTVTLTTVLVVVVVAVLIIATA